MTDGRIKAAEKLHGHLSSLHLRRSVLIGPDPESRFDYRIGRFVKSYLPSLGRNETHCYLQAQAYWILANWRLFDLTGSRVYWTSALASAHSVIERQHNDGSWRYSNPGNGRAATNEGSWAALALLETYRQTGGDGALNSAVRWQCYLTMVTGYQKVGATLAVNYFPGRAAGRVPSHSATLARLLCELSQATGQTGLLEDVPALLSFVAQSQQATGEVAYAIHKLRQTPSRLHFQCYQHNAFEALNLLRIRELALVDGCGPVIDGIVRFLKRGVGRNGAVPQECGTSKRNVVYHAGVVAAGLEQASAAGFGNYLADAARAYRYVLGRQLPGGGFPYSFRDYGFLRDTRSYPRYQAMILYHLLHPLPAVQSVPTQAQQSEFAATG